jgi:hypothetical protein
MLPWIFSGYGNRYNFGYPSARMDAQLAAEEQVMPVEQRLQHLEMACAGLWELLKTKVGCTDDELIAAIHAIDMQDGKADGRVGTGDATCPNCHRKLLTRTSPKCAWCGADLHRDPFKRI